jgi:hypothetical protein
MAWINYYGNRIPEEYWDRANGRLDIDRIVRDISENRWWITSTTIVDDLRRLGFSLRGFRSDLITAYDGTTGTRAERVLALLDRDRPTPIPENEPRDTDTFGITLPRAFSRTFQDMGRSWPREQLARALVRYVAPNGPDIENPGAVVMENLLTRAGISFSQYDPAVFARVYNTTYGANRDHAAALASVLGLQVALNQAPGAVESLEARRAHWRRDRPDSGNGSWLHITIREDRLDLEDLAGTIRGGGNLQSELENLNRAGIQFNRAGQIAYLEARLRQGDGWVTPDMLRQALIAADDVSGRILQGPLGPDGRPDPQARNLLAPPAPVVAVTPDPALAERREDTELRRRPLVRQAELDRGGDPLPDSPRALTPNPNESRLHQSMADILARIPAGQRGAFDRALAMLRSGRTAPGTDPDTNREVWRFLIAAAGGESQAANLLRQHAGMRGDDASILTRLRTGSLGNLTRDLVRSPEIQAAIGNFQTALATTSGYTGDIDLRIGSGTFAAAERASTDRGHHFGPHLQRTSQLGPDVDDGQGTRRLAAADQPSLGA